MFKVFKDKRHLVEFCCGLAVVLTMILFVAFKYEGKQQLTMATRALVGGIIGYALARAAFGFAGSVNRAYNTGSTKLMKALAVLFILGGIVTFVALITGRFNFESLWTNSINYGLLFGATLFGFGMAFTVCCASGVLTDLAESPLKALSVLLFFCLGAFFGKGLANQPWMAWYKKPVFGIETFKDGINFVEMGKGNIFGGAFAGLIFTVILATIVIVLADFYERRRKAAGTYVGCGSEIAQEEEAATHVKDENEGVELFYNVFVKPWSLYKGAFVIAIAFAILALGAGTGWGVSGPLREWGGRLVGLFGADPEWIKSFTANSVDVTKPFWGSVMNVQDLSIFLGALVAFLFAGNFTRNVKGWLFNPLELVLYAIGGLCLGVAINVAGGCNAGGLFSPIATYSISGWIYLVCIIVGGIAGNFVRKHFRAACKLQ